MIESELRTGTFVSLIPDSGQGSVRKQLNKLKSRPGKGSSLEELKFTGSVEMTIELDFEGAKEDNDFIMFQRTDVDVHANEDLPVEEVLDAEILKEKIVGQENPEPRSDIEEGPCSSSKVVLEESHNPESKDDTSETSLFIENPTSSTPNEVVESNGNNQLVERPVFNRLKRDSFEDESLQEKIENFITQSLIAIDANDCDIIVKKLEAIQQKSEAVESQKVDGKVQESGEIKETTEEILEISLSENNQEHNGLNSITHLALVSPIIDEEYLVTESITDVFSLGRYSPLKMNETNEVLDFNLKDDHDNQTDIQRKLDSIMKLVQEQSSTIAKQTVRIECLENKNKVYENELKAAQRELESLKTKLEKQISDTTSQLLSTTVQMEAFHSESKVSQTTIEAKLLENSTELRCIKTDLSGFNQVNKDFLHVVKDKMSSFDSRVNSVVEQVEETCKKIRNERKNADWNLKVEMENRLMTFKTDLDANNEKMAELTSVYDDIHDRIWEIEKSWRNNLTFHGIRYDDKSFEEDPKRTEDKIREVIKIDLQMTRDIPILRAVRIKNGPMVKKTHPILVSFQNYNDKEDILRRSKLIRGIDGSAGHGVAALGCQTEPGLYITEENSRRIRASRQELMKFCREIHKRFPDKRCEIKFDRLFVDNDVYVWNEKSNKIERIAINHPDSKRSASASKYSKTFLEVNEEEIQSRYMTQRYLSSSALDLAS